MKIGGLQKMTLIDYPGKVACTVFTVGCNFRCPFCYNSELVFPEKNTPTTSEEEFFNFLNKRKGLLDGVCVTGGEPTIHQDLLEFIQKIKDLKFLVKLDTNGTNPETLKQLLNKNLLDYIAMDIKSSVNGYKKAVGTEVDMENIKKSIKLIMNSGIEYEFRTTVVPGIHSKEDILEIAKEIKGAKKYYLQQFRPDAKMIDQKLRKVDPYQDIFFKKIVEEIKDNFEVCEVRGLYS